MLEAELESAVANIDKLQDDSSRLKSVEEELAHIKDVKTKLQNQLDQLESEKGVCETHKEDQASLLYPLCVLNKFSPIIFNFRERVRLISF